MVHHSWPAHLRQLPASVKKVGGSSSCPSNFSRTPQPKLNFARQTTAIVIAMAPEAVKGKKRKSMFFSKHCCSQLT